jgi:hemoglobin
MADEITMKRGPVGRRSFLRGAGGLAVFGGAFVLVGCGDDDDDTPATTAPAATTAATTAATAAASPTTGGSTLVLYERLGGGDAIQAVIDDFLGNVAADDRINSFFANANLPRLNMMLVNQIGEATGGPEKYTGGDMKTVHAGMEITMDDFNALVEDLVKSLDKFDVPEAEKNELLAVLGPMSDDIVTA